MAEINPSPLLQSPPHQIASDPKSPIISQSSNPQNPIFLKLTTDSFSMERGPRFKEYSALRERKLRMNRLDEQRTSERDTEENVENRSVLTPQKKQVKFNSNFTTPPKRTKMPSALTQSVPNFSLTLRKENRRPVVEQVKFNSNFTTPPKRTKIPSALTQSVPDFSSTLRKKNRRPVAERSSTPPEGMSKSGRMYGKVGGGSKSTNSAEKRSGGIIARKSFANMDELKKLGVSAGKEINRAKRRNFY